MKVDNLLAQYLYKYKRLSLYGIGIFTLDEHAVFPDESAKVKTQIEGVSFESKPSALLDDSLIEYIKNETGKMKALAEADLDSYVELAHQFLNIGKPFYFEGIGTLQKNKDGTFSFNAGTAVPLKAEETAERYGEPKRKSTFADEKENKGIGINPVKLLLVFGILATIALIGWGGYYLYNKNTDDDQLVSIENTNTSLPDTQVVKNNLTDTNTISNNSTAEKKDSISTVPVKQTITATIAPASNTDGIYKFIFESTDKKTRALQRYNQIKDMSVLKVYHKIQMETKDSVNFNIFMMVPCVAADTLRYKDSLNVWYYGTKKMKVKIAH